MIFSYTIFKWDFHSQLSCRPVFQKTVLDQSKWVQLPIAGFWDIFKTSCSLVAPKKAKKPDWTWLLNTSSTLDQVLLSPIACLQSNCSSPAFTRPFQAWLLAFHPIVSIWAQHLVSHPWSGPFEPDCLSLTQPYPFECNCSFPAFC